MNGLPRPAKWILPSLGWLLLLLLPGFAENVQCAPHISTGRLPPQKGILNHKTMGWKESMRRDY